MPTLIEPLEEFRTLNEAAVMAALDDPDPANPIANEVARLITGYAANFADHCRQLGRIPADIVLAKPSSSIETVAVRLATQMIRSTLAARMDEMTNG